MEEPDCFLKVTLFRVGFPELTPGRSAVAAREAGCLMLWWRVLFEMVSLPGSTPVVRKPRRNGF